MGGGNVDISLVLNAFSNLIFLMFVFVFLIDLVDRKTHEKSQ